MIIKETVREIDYGGWSEKVGWELNIDDETEMSMCNLNECPEDAILDRDLGFVCDIITLLEKSYEMGKKGVEIEFVSEVIQERE